MNWRRVDMDLILEKVCLRERCQHCGGNLLLDHNVFYGLRKKCLQCSRAYPVNGHEPAIYFGKLRGSHNSNKAKSLPGAYA